jgi:transposase
MEAGFLLRSRDRVVLLVFDQVRDNEPLRRWVRQAERDTGMREGLATSECEELKRLQREDRELKKANEILRPASAYCALAELARQKGDQALQLAEIGIKASVDSIGDA